MLKKIYEENAVELVAVPEGVILVSNEQNLEDKAVVSYKFFSFRTKKILQATRDVYLRGKFGENYERISAQLPDYVNYRCTRLDDGRLLCVYPTGAAAAFSPEGVKVWSGEMKHRDFEATDIVCVGKYIWVSFSNGNAIVRYNPATMREELRLGGENDKSFSRPCGLAAAKGKLIVCNSESKCIEAINIDSYTMERLASFEEPVYQYVKSGAEGVVLLASGAYIL